MPACTQACSCPISLRPVCISSSICLEEVGKMLRRKKRRIAHGTDSADVAVDADFQQERRSIFAGLRSKWGKASMHGGFYSEKKKEAPGRVLSRRLPRIRLRVRMLLKKVKETCLKFFSSQVLCRRNNVDGDCSHVKRTHHAAMTSTRVGCGPGFRSSTKLNHQHHQYKLHHQHDHHCHEHKQYYAIFPSLADEHAIADCIEFIKRSSSSSSSASSSSSSASSSSSSCMGGMVEADKLSA